MCPDLNQPAIERLECVVCGEKNFAFPLPHHVCSPKGSLAPKPLHLSREMKLIEWPDVHEVGVLPRHLIRVLIFLNGLTTAAPFAYFPDRFLVKPLEYVLGRKTSADDHQHHMFPAVEWIPPSDQMRDAAVATPILLHSAEKGEPARQIFLLKVCLLLITPHDVPLGITQVCLVLWTRVVRDAGRHSCSVAGSLRGRWNLPLQFAMPAAYQHRDHQQQRQRETGNQNSDHTAK